MAVSGTKGYSDRIWGPEVDFTHQVPALCEKVFPGASLVWPLESICLFYHAVLKKSVIAVEI